MFGFTKKQETIAKINDIENTVSFFKKLMPYPIKSTIILVLLKICNIFFSFLV